MTQLIIYLILISFYFFPGLVSICVLIFSLSFVSLLWPCLFLLLVKPAYYMNAYMENDLLLTVSLTLRERGSNALRGGNSAPDHTHGPCFCTYSHVLLPGTLGVTMGTDEFPGQLSCCQLSPHPHFPRSFPPSCPHVHGEGTELKFVLPSEQFPLGFWKNALQLR